MSRPWLVFFMCSVFFGSGRRLVMMLASFTYTALLNQKDVCALLGQSAACPALSRL